jgi:hypothetical protein
VEFYWLGPSRISALLLSMILKYIMDEIWFSWGEIQNMRGNFVEGNG